MKKSSTYFFGISFLLLISSCGEKAPGQLQIQSETPGQLQSETPHHLMLRDHEANVSLHDEDISYKDNYKSFSSSGRPISPCKESLLSTIDTSLSEKNSIIEELGHSKSNFRGELLNFHRKLKNSIKSLSIINKELKSYCTQDYTTFNSCTFGDESVKVLINKHVKSYAYVQPYIITHKNSRYGFVRFEDGDLRSIVSHQGRLSSINTKSAVNENHRFYADDVKNILSCIRNNKINSTTGRTLVSTLEAMRIIELTPDNIH